MNITPSKLQMGDELRIIAPSSSMSIVSEETITLATQRLEHLGFKITFGEHIYETDPLMTSSIPSRIDDLHAAFSDPNVKGILCVLGGFNCNQLLKYIHFDLIQKNPKVFLGYSDITALSNAITHKTGLITYSGCNFTTFGMKYGFEYTLDSFIQCLTKEQPYLLQPADSWSDDEWYRDQENRTFHVNEGWEILQEGRAEGTLIGGNLCTFNLLQGTEFMPSLKNTILFLEDDDVSDPKTFDRDLQSLLHLPDVGQIKGLVIGRFQQSFHMTPELLRYIISTKQELIGIPIIANVDFGHTFPSAVFPIGGRIKIDVSNQKQSIHIIHH